MKRLIFCIFFHNLFFFSSFCQDCKDLFIHDLKQSFNEKNKSFAVVVSKSMKEYYKHKGNKEDSLKFINIPAINFSKDVGWCNCMDKSKFLCYLNSHEIFFNEVLVYSKDSLFLGIVSECASKKCKYDFTDKFRLDLRCTNHFTALQKILKEIRPELVFWIYNMPDIYLFIRNDELYFLDYQRDCQNYRLFRASDYIEKYIKSEDIKYIKQVKVPG